MRDNPPSEVTHMPRCLVAHTDGRLEEVFTTQANATHILGGSVSLVGAFDEIRVFAVARKDADALAPNCLCIHKDRFHDLPLRGPVLFVATGDEGEEIDVDVEALQRLLTQFPCED